MGFCTANIELPAIMQTLGEGVYAAWATVDGVRYKAAMSMGVAPTFSTATATSEVHILDFSGRIYGDTILVEPVHFLRPMIKFDSVDELIATVQDNIAWVRANL
ncbi:MAG: riboflavin kinase [Slackia sp.]|nr:riboflavin kinase [Slackia sp.]